MLIPPPTVASSGLKVNIASHIAEVGCYWAFQSLAATKKGESATPDGENGGFFNIEWERHRHRTVTGEDRRSHFNVKRPAGLGGILYVFQMAMRRRRCNRRN